MKMSVGSVLGVAVDCCRCHVLVGAALLHSMVVMMVVVVGGVNLKPAEPPAAWQHAGHGGHPHPRKAAQWVSRQSSLRNVRTSKPDH